MIKDVIFCDKCKSACGKRWFTVYGMQGGYHDGKVKSREDICEPCYMKMLSVLVEGKEVKR